MTLDLNDIKSSRLWIEAECDMKNYADQDRSG